MTEPNEIEANDEPSSKEDLEELDYAMQVYLGGDPNTGSIQIGMKNERLAAEFFEDAERLKKKLEEILKAVLKCPVDWEQYDIHTAAPFVSEWLATEMPHFSETTRKKMASHFCYQFR